MALQKIRVQRNLRARMRWFVFEIEDVILLGFLWAATEVGSNLIERTVFGVPAEVILPWMAVIAAYVALRVFKYGKPPAYLIDLYHFFRLPHIYDAAEPDPAPARRYLREDNA